MSSSSLLTTEPSESLVVRHAPALSVLGAVVVLIGAVVLNLFTPTRTWTNEPLHSAAEAAGGVIALGLVGVIRLRRRVVGDDAPHYVWLNASLGVMGVLDIVHACSRVGPAFFWSRALPTLLGGLLAAGVWLPTTEPLSRSRAKNSRLQRLPTFVMLLAIPIGAALLFAPGAWPAAFDPEFRYTTWARLLNVLGGVGFLSAAAFLLRYARQDDTDHRSGSRLYAGRGETSVFAVQNLLLGVAGLLFWLSQVWSPVWWLFHGVRLVAYAVALGSTAHVYRGIEATHRGHIERELAAQMAELEHMRSDLVRMEREAAAGSTRPDGV